MMNTRNRIFQLGLAFVMAMASVQVTTAEPTKRADKFSQSQLLKNTIETSTFSFGENYRSWARLASDSLERMQRAERLNTQTKAILTIMLRGTDEPNEWNPFPYYTEQEWKQVLNKLKEFAGTEESLARTTKKIMRKGQYVSPIVPVAEVLAAHKANEVVPVLVRLYFDTDEHWNKVHYFYALTRFNDPRALPVINDWWSRNSKRLSTDENIARWDIIPLVRETLDKPEAGENADHADIRKSAQELADLFNNSTSVVIEEAMTGEIKRRDPKKATVMVFGPDETWQTIYLPFDATLQADTEASFNEQGVKITDLNSELVKTNATVTATNARVDKTNESLATTQKDVADAESKISDLQSRTAKLTLNLEGLNTKVDANRAAAADEVKKVTDTVTALRAFVDGELKKRDPALSLKVETMENKIKELQDRLKILNDQVNPRSESSETSKSRSNPNKG